MLDSLAGRRPIPFYQPYAVFYRAMRLFKEGGLPSRVETRYLADRLKYEASRVVSGFSALGWIDETGKPTDDLRALVETFGESGWSQTLADIVPRTYFFITKSVDDLTPIELHEAFVRYAGRDVDAIRSAETFYLCLAQESGAKLPEVFYRRASRALVDAHKVLHEAPAGERAAGGSAPSVDPAPSESQTVVMGRSDMWVERIVELSGWLSTEMSREEKDAVLTLLAYLKKQAAER